MKQIKDWLMQWGYWSREKIGTEYKRKAVYILEQGGKGVIITDDEAMIVDNAIANLKRYDYQGYNMLVAFYQYQQSCRAISRTINKRPDYVTACLGRAEAYVAGRMSNYLDITI